MNQILPVYDRSGFRTFPNLLQLESPALNAPAKLEVEKTDKGNNNKSSMLEILISNFKFAAKMNLKIALKYVLPSKFWQLLKIKEPF